MDLKNKNTIKVEELRILLEKKLPVQILDVRTKEEREEWSIPESIFVDVYTDLKAGRKNLFSHLNLSKDIPIVTLCAAGKTSLIATEQLRDKGMEAYSLDGGMREWTAAWNTAQIADSSKTNIIQVRRAGKGCLSYILENNGEAIVIDASLKPDIYIAIASSNSWKIKYVIDTHIHADHFSRSNALANLIKATLLLPKQQLVSYKFNEVSNGDIIKFGNAKLKAIHTPGHTPESFSYLLNEESLFSGDTLFVDGVGRPDLKATTAISKLKAKSLYESLQNLFTLDALTMVYPGHISAPIPFNNEIISKSLNNIKKEVHMLQLNEQEFISNLLQKIPETPPNYEEIVSLNLTGNANHINLTELEAGANRCAIS
ncbi:MBL fold metallo-hydrolase [Tenacibaculum maritimum]|uniref:MBL fold metallo-hydrolase n=1 Tax=Tenacibaculum maritimum TaxID=107401 RepID=UPI0012E5FEFB|nr:MBL fold metallo-hydrolase [Tenacibaculum maritimum]CAA0146245.1 conserved hypothetical protein [Tenacibaculum maritimum]CAA0146330.1 conserved hypothetical protein [Tenacibaculum maritimum]CAA0146334.1 conserved hypothetical protein [Tenacibaculum maritimum]CAA0154583.1 conserved hypothetical protein [Tenacibaculum maritimum]CAA0253073.1 conserved hypothetical protein [Tenacibaculum maritimum]